MSRLPVAAFAALVVATVGAFFVSQHLKVTTPLIAGIGPAQPGAINPIAGVSCGGVNHRVSRFSFYLLHRTDDVDVYVVDQSGNVVRTVASGRHMRRGVRIPDGVFRWNGRTDDHRVAPDGTYEIQVVLIHQGRSVTLADPSGPITITVRTVPPRPVVDRVSPQLIPQGGHAVAIHYSGNEQRGATVRLYRTDVAGTPRLVKTFLTPWTGQSAVWDGKIHGRPAPAGTYLVGLQVSDAACNTSYFPARMPPAPGSIGRVGVTVRYLAAAPPLDPVPAGGVARVHVDSAGGPYQWSLVRVGAPRPAASGMASSATLDVPVPPGRAGLYELELRSAGHTTAVPIVVTSPAPSPRAAPLVVLPALTWQGLNPVDQTGTGLPSTLTAAGPIELARPLAHGLPPGFADEAGLLAYLDSAHRPYQLSTDLGLIHGVGPRLSGHPAVILAGPELWLPASTRAALRSYGAAGGHILSFGVDSLRRGVIVQAGRASHPTAAAAVDALGATRGVPVGHDSRPLTVNADALGLFSGAAGTFPAFGPYQPLPAVAAPAQILSAAGATPGSPAIIGYQLGRGTVVQVAVAGVGAALRRDAAARALVGGIWKALGG